ncbi:uroporphyrinogen decarboxylase family protein [Enterovirga aerilata]|uniref:uroporphyrinogen decarboxylase family protein n=1 Tax=Enterovirga aerilata TaxID=2730920 RepID=UPI003211F14F
MKAIMIGVGREFRARHCRRTTLLGFCGAPWTVVAYMVAGRGARPIRGQPSRLAGATPAS